MRLSNGFVIDKEKTFGELKFTAVRDVFLQNEDGTPRSWILYYQREHPLFSAHAQSMQYCLSSEKGHRPSIE